MFEVEAISLPSAFQWTDNGNESTHVDFFGLDLGIGFGPDLVPVPSPDTAASIVPIDENLRKWAEITSSQEASPQPHFMSSTTQLSPDVSTLVNSTTNDDKPIKKRPFMSEEISEPAKPAVKAQKTFHFVDNDDKKEATRLRNTTTSRNLRQSKISRIAELERLLEESQRQAKRWEQRAREAGWSDE